MHNHKLLRLVLPLEPYVIVVIHNPVVNVLLHHREILSRRHAQDLTTTHSHDLHSLIEHAFLLVAFILLDQDQLVQQLPASNHVTQPADIVHHLQAVVPADEQQVQLAEGDAGRQLFVTPADNENVADLRIECINVLLNHVNNRGDDAPHLESVLFNDVPFDAQLPLRHLLMAERISLD